MNLRPFTSIAVRMLLIVIMLAFGRICQAARPAADGIFPAETVAFLAVYNAPDLKERLGKTSLGKMSQDPQLKPLVTQLYGTLAQTFSVVETQVGASLDEILSIPQGEIALGLIAHPDKPLAVVLALDYGNRKAIVDRLLDRATQALAQANAERSEESVGEVKFTIYRFGGDGPRELAWCKYDGTLLVASSVDALKQVLALAAGGEGATLAGDPDFAAIRSRCGGGGSQPLQALVYVNPIAITHHVATQRGVNAIVDVFLPRLGLDGLLGLGGSMSVATDQYDVLTHAHVLVNNPRKAVFEAIAFESGETAPPAWMPSDAAAYTCFYWDFSRTLREIGKMYDAFTGREGAFAQLVNDRLGTRLGVDVEKELLPALSGKVAFGSVIERPVGLTSQGWIAGLGLKDPAEFQSLLEKILAKYPERFEKKSYGRHAYYSLARPLPGPTGEAASGQRPSMGILGEDLVIADRQSLFEQATITASDPEKSLAASLEYKLIASKASRLAGDDKLSLLAFNRPEESMRFMYDLVASQDKRQETRNQIGRFEWFKGIDQAIEQALTNNPLPPFSVLQQYLAPGGAVLTEDDTGFHYVAFTLKRADVADQGTASK